jgi:hypothetical protein
MKSQLRRQLCKLRVVLPEVLEHSLCCLNDGFPSRIKQRGYGPRDQSRGCQTTHSSRIRASNYQPLCQGESRYRPEAPDSTHCWLRTGASDAENALRGCEDRTRQADRYLIGQYSIAGGLPSRQIPFVKSPRRRGSKDRRNLVSGPQGIVILAFVSFPTFNHLDDLPPLGLGIPSACSLVKGAANEVGIHHADGNGGGLIVNCESATLRSQAARNAPEHY